MSEKIESIRAETLKRISDAGTLQDLEDIRVRALGRKGLLTEILRGISEAPAEERRVLGHPG